MPAYLSGGHRRSRSKSDSSLGSLGVQVGLGVGIAGVAALSFYALSRKRERVPLSAAHWRGAVDADGRLKEGQWQAVLEQISLQGVELDAKRDVWPYLLGVFSPTMTKEEKDALLDRYRQGYERLIEICQDKEAQIFSCVQEREAQSAAACATPDLPSSSAMCEADGAGLRSPAHAGSNSPGPDQPTGPSTAEAVEVFDDPLRAPAAVGLPPALSSSALGSASASPQPSGDVLQSKLSGQQPQRGPGQPPAHEHPNAVGAAISGGHVPDDLRQFYEAQRIIIMDAIRTDWKKNSLTTADAIASWFSSALADTQVYQRLSARDEWWQGRWLPSAARHQLELTNHFSSDQKRQVLRLVNLLCAYAVHDPETGYCQGMSDLALPCLLLFEDDALAFWCFQRLMCKVRRNFAVEDSGIFAQLASLARLLEHLDGTLWHRLRQVRATDCHFAYRMIVVLLRRELPLDQALRLWEMLWADDQLASLPAHELSAEPQPSSQLPPVAVGMGSVPSDSKLPAGSASARELSVLPTSPAASLAHPSEDALPAVAMPTVALASASAAPGGKEASTSGQELHMPDTPARTPRLLSCAQPEHRSVTSDPGTGISAAAAAEASGQGPGADRDVSDDEGTSSTKPGQPTVQEPAQQPNTPGSEGPLTPPDSPLSGSGLKHSESAEASSAGTQPQPIAEPTKEGKSSESMLSQLVSPRFMLGVRGLRGPVPSAPHAPEASPFAAVAGVSGTNCLEPSAGANPLAVAQAAALHRPADGSRANWAAPVAIMWGSTAGAAPAPLAATAGLDDAQLRASSGSAGVAARSCDAAGTAPSSVMPEGGAAPAEEASTSQAGTADANRAGGPLFMYLVAAVVISQKRRLLDECQDSDDVLRLFQSLRSVDVVELVNRAKVFRRKLVDAAQELLREQEHQEAGVSPMASETAPDGDPPGLDDSWVEVTPDAVPLATEP